MRKHELRGLAFGIDCPKCNGYGYIPDDNDAYSPDGSGPVCEYCDGTGVVDSYLNGIEYANGVIERN